VAPYLVSVIVCTYNRAVLLPRVIAQLCSQDYPQDSFEIIIVDNASTDETAQEFQRIASGYCLPLRYVREARPGVTFARNRGAAEARYPYLAYLDDDCIVGSNWLSQLTSGFGLNEQVSIVVGPVVLDADEQKLPTWLGPAAKRWLAEFNFPSSQPLLLDNPSYIIEGNMAIRKNAWKSVGGFLGMDQFNSPHVAAQENVYLLEQIKAKGGKVAFVPGALVNHRPSLPTKQQILNRAYFHGVSTGMLNYLIKGSSWRAAISRAAISATAMLVFLFLSLLNLFVFREVSSMDYLVRAAGRLGRVLSELRLTGNWSSVRAWALEHKLKS